MADKTPITRRNPLNVYDKPQSSGVSGIELTASIVSAVWLVGSVVFFIVVPVDDRDGQRRAWFLLTMLTIFLPVAMIWVAAMVARSSRIMREESARLKTAIDAMRETYISHNRNQSSESAPAVSRKLDEIAAATRKTETALATFQTSRQVPSRPKPIAARISIDDQPGLALGTEAEASDTPLSNADFIQALNFPETAEDEAGFTALRRALQDRTTAKIVQASQDVLTLLSQDGIYMDDLRPDLARADIWRAFAQGTRGIEVALLGGIRDRSSLALISGRMRQDPIFRDAAHHFLRRFDTSFAAFEAQASDAEILAFADTRTARVFMLLGRVAGTFD